uniref:Protein ELYS n=1 Tax=Timema douglasi TaxID=61478 RepID=A0A7R8VR56_TIMDO|nr:unnamed protein product [Timema douglasi]
MAGIIKLGALKDKNGPTVPIQIPRTKDMSTTYCFRPWTQGRVRSASTPLVTIRKDLHFFMYVKVVMNPEENRCRVSREAQFPTSVLKYIHLDKPQEDRVYPVKGGLFNDGKLAWLSYGPRLDVVCMKTGLRRGYWRFGVPLPDCQTVVTCVIELPAGTASGRVRRLLVGLNSDVEGGRVCVFDFVSSKVLRAVAVPAPVSSMCVVDHGYEGTGSRYPLPRLVNSMSGIVSVGLVNGQLLLLDLCRMAYEEDLRNDSVLRNELNCSRLIPVSVNERDPNMVEKKRMMSARTGDHLCVLLSEPCCLEGVSQREARPQDDGMITCVQYVPSIASLLVGFSTGCFQIWSVMHMALEYTSPVLRGSSQAITHLAFQEASDDPKSYCYVWAVCEGDPTENCTALMYMLEYKSRDLVDGYGFLYMDFMQAYHVFELELGVNESENLNSHCLGCYTLTRNLPSKRDNGGNRDDGETETDLSLCMFSWECGGVVHLTLFDLNMWYKAQMPKTPSCLGPHTLSSFLGVQVLKDVLETCTPKGPMLEVRVVAESVRRYKGIQALDEHFFPSALTFDGHGLNRYRLVVMIVLSEFVCLMERGGVSLSHTSNQLLLLSQLAKSGAATFLHPNDFFHRCNFAGLRPVLSDVSGMDSVSVSEQRNFLLSLALDKNLLGVLTRCINEWSDGCYSGQGCSFEMLLDWAWGRTVLVRQQVDELCKPLFDTTGLGLDSNWCRRLRHCGLLFKRLHIVFEAACAAKPPGVCDLTKRTQVLELLTMYVEVIQWFLGVGLLPEHPVDSEHTSYYTVPYPVTTIHAFYQRRREEMKALGLEAPLRSTAVSPGEDMLLIDGLVSHECGNSDKLSALWKVDGGSGLYPPPSIQSLLQTYLQTNTDMTVKHCIVIYVLLDLAFELHKDERYASALEKFVEFPTTFSMSPSVIKVAQAFWFLDHKEFEDALNLLSQVMVRPEDLRPWQHRAIIRAFLLQGHPEMAMSYITVRSPVVQDSQDVLLHQTVLLSNGLIHDAFQFQRVHRTQENCSELLNLFYSGCILKNKLKTVISLQLSDLEEGHLMKFLDSLDSPRADDVEVFYYLKQERIIEALERNDLIKKRRMAQRGSNSLKRKRHQNYESTTRETWLRAYANTLPALTREITQHCLDKRDVFVNWQQVERPIPLSVNVCPGGLQPARCKSSLIHSALMKAKETWVKIPETPHTRHSIVQSTPFLCTPHTATYTDGSRPEVPEVIPKLLSAPESTQDDDYDDDDMCEVTPFKRARYAEQTLDKLDDPLRLLQSPHIRRSMGTQTSFTTPGRYLTGSSSDAPQSILKVTRLRGMSTTPEVFDTSDDEDEVPLSRRIRFSLPEEPTVDSSSPAGSPNAASPGGPTPRRNIHTGQERIQRMEDGLLCASKTTRFTDLERSQPLLSDISEEINSVNNSEEDSSYFRRVSGRLSLLENKQSSPREELGSASKSEGNKSITSKLAEDSSLIENTKNKSQSEITPSTLDKMGEEPSLTVSSTESTSINRRIASRFSLSTLSTTSKDITTSGDSHDISRNSSVVKNITRSSTSFLSSTLASVSTEDSSQGKSTSNDRMMTRSSSSIKTSFTSASFVEKESQALDAKKSNSTKRSTLSGRKSFRQSVLQESASATVSGSVSPTYDSSLTTPESTDNSNKRESQSSYITANSDTSPSVPTNLAPEVCVLLDTSSDDSDIDRFNSSFGTHHGGAASSICANETNVGEVKNGPEAKENSVTQSLLTLDDLIEASTKNFASQSVDNNLLNEPERAGIRSEGVNESDRGILLDDTSVGVALFSPQVINYVIEDSADSKGTSNPTSRAPDKDELVITELVNAAPLPGFDENLSVDGRIDVKLSTDVAYPPFPSEELDYLDYYEAENSCDNDNFVDTSSALVDLCDSDQGSDGKGKEKRVENYFSLSDDNINDSESEESPLPSTWLSQEDRKPSQQASLNQSNDSVVILDTDSDIDDWLDQQHLPSFAEVQKGIATKSLDSTKVDNKNEGATGAVGSMSQVEQEMSKDIGVNLLQFSQQSDDLVDALEASKAIATVGIHSSDNKSLDYGKPLDEVIKASLENSTDKANTTAGYSKKSDEKRIKEDSNVHAEDIFYDISQTSTEISNSESKEAASLSNDFSKHAKANIDRFEKTDDTEKTMSITDNVETNMSKVVSRTCCAEDTSAQIMNTCEFIQTNCTFQVSDVPAVKVAEEGCKQVPSPIGNTAEESLKTCNENKSSLKQGAGSSLLKTKSRRRSSSTSVDKNGRAKSVKSRRSSSVEPDFVSASKVAGIRMETGESLHNLPQDDEINVEVITSRDEVESVLPVSSSKTPRATAEKLLSSSPVNVVNSLSKNVDDNSYSSDKVSNRLRSSYSNTTTTQKKLDNSGLVRGDSSASSQYTLSSDKKSERKESSSLASDQDCLDLGVSMTDSSFGDISSVLKFESEPTSAEKKQNIYSETKVTTRSSSVSCRKSCDGPPGSVLGTILEAPANEQPAKSGTDLTKSVNAAITQEGKQDDERRGNKQNINSEGETLVFTTTRRRRSLSTSGKESLVDRASSEPFKSQRGYSVNRDLTPVLETKPFKSTSFDNDKGSKPTVTHVAALLKKSEHKIKESKPFSNRSKFVENEDGTSPGKSITKRRRSSSVSSHDNQFLPANLEESPQKKRKTSSVQGDFAPVLKVSKVTKVTVAQSGKEESTSGTSGRIGTLRSRRALVESENKLGKSTFKQRRRSTSQSEVSEAHTAMTDNSLRREDKTKRRSSSSDITPFNLSLRRRRSGASGFGSLLEPVAEGPEPLEDSSTEPVSAQSRCQAVEMYATARRLTRHQRALMQRSMDLSRPLQAGRYTIVNRQTSGACKYDQELLILSKFPHRESSSSSSSSSSPVSSLRLDHDDPSSHFDDVTDDDDDTSSVKTRSSARRPSLCLSQVSTVKVPTVVNQESTSSTHREVSTARSLRSGKVYATSGSETSSDVSTVRIESAPSRLASSPSSIASERTVQMRRRSLRKAKDSLSAHATPTKNSGPSESGESTKDSPPKDRKTLHTRKALSMELHTIQEKSKEGSFDSSDKQTGSRAPQEGLLSPVAGPSTLRSATTKTPLFARRRSKNKSRSQPQLSEETPSTEAGPSRRQTTKKTKTPKHRKSKSRSLRSCASSQESPPAFRMGRNRLTVFQLRRFSKKKTTQEK